MLDRLKKINVLGITVLIIAVVYLLVTLLNSLSETKYFVGLFIDYGFLDTVYNMMEAGKVVSIVYVTLSMIAPYLLIAAGIFFVIAAVKRKGSIEIPVGLSLFSDFFKRLPETHWHLGRG